MNFKHIPDTWMVVELKDIGHIITGNTPPKKDAENYGNFIPFVKPPELNDKPIIEAQDNLSKKGAKLARILPPKSILVSCIGGLGKTGYNKVPIAFNQQINAIVFPEGIDPIFGFYYCQTLKNWLYDCASATTLPIVNKTKFGKAPFPIAPLSEQHRIVSKIEELFTKLDAGVEALKKAKAQLNRYRQAVLKSAFEGKLTEEWRNSVAVKMEPASVILDTIKSDLWKGKKNWHIDDQTMLPKLPENWEWTYVGFIGETITGNTPSKKKASYYGDEYPFYKPSDLNSGYYVSNSIDGLSSAGMELARCAQEKSTLVTCIGATIGKTGFVRKKGAFNQQINGIIPNESIISEYTYFVCNSPQFQSKIRQKASSTTLPILNKSKFQNLPFPVPPLHEQREIVQKLENQFAFIERIENDINSLFGKCIALNRKILSNAFQGKLVSQDPTDEPASKLLERIKTDKDR